MKRNNWRGRNQSAWRDRRRHNRRRYRGQYEWNQIDDSGASVSQQNSSSTSAAEPTSSASVPPDVPELPGYYYDREKDRYFRLLLGHNNYNPLTWETIKNKEMEAKRLKMLEEDAETTRVARMGMDFTTLLQKRHFGRMNSESYLRLVHELKVSTMRRNQLDIQSSDTSSTSNFKMISADTNCERIFAVKSDETGYKYGILNLDGRRKESRLVSAVMCANLYVTHRKGTSICWASLSGRDSHVLLCLQGHADTPGCVSLLPASIFSNSNSEDQPSMLCNFKSATALTCAWCFNPQADKCFSTGLLHCVFVTDAVTGQKQTFSTSSSVFAQHFARRVPVLYNGCRSGEIFSIDIRQRTKKGQSWKATTLHHNSSVISIKLLQDENYLMAADLIGKIGMDKSLRSTVKIHPQDYLWIIVSKIIQMFTTVSLCYIDYCILENSLTRVSVCVGMKIKLWDLRNARCVREYEGHHIEHAYLPIHINEEEGILLAVGQDCYTRIWSLCDGCLLRTIPSPYPACSDSIPNVAFSSQWGGRGGVPGLLMAVRQDLYHFAYSPNL
uniref:WD repeat domain 21 n=1 Tax=Pristiophorus japonicus TaxID=55135 RepID=UPI00398F2568